MKNWKTDEFLPNWASAPGETILDLLQEKCIGITAFMEMMEEDGTFIQGLFDGNEKITKRVAKKLSKNLGSTEAFWLKRESNYRRDLIRLGKK